MTGSVASLSGLCCYVVCRYGTGLVDCKCLNLYVWSLESGTLNHGIEIDRNAL